MLQHQLCQVTSNLERALYVTLYFVGLVVSIYVSNNHYMAVDCSRHMTVSTVLLVENPSYLQFSMSVVGDKNQRCSAACVNG